MNITDSEGETPLLHAVKQGYDKCLDLMIKSRSQCECGIF